MIKSNLVTYLAGPDLAEDEEGLGGAGECGETADGEADGLAAARVLLVADEDDLPNRRVWCSACF